MLRLVACKAPRGRAPNERIFASVANKSSSALTPDASKAAAASATKTVGKWVPGSTTMEQYVKPPGFIEGISRPSGPWDANKHYPLGYGHLINSDGTHRSTLNMNVMKSSMVFSYGITVVVFSFVFGMQVFWKHYC